MKYLLTLKNKETRTIEVLKIPLYPCVLSDEGNILYKPMSELESNANVKFVDKNDPHYLFNDVCGIIRGETELFDIYKGLKNPIVELKVIAI